MKQRTHSMDIIGRRTLLVLLLAVMPLCGFAFEGDQYRLGAGDRIQVQVYGEADLSLSFSLGDSGTINYPFLGQISVSGLTLSELEQKITSGLKGDYLINPSVHASVVEYRPFFIYGEVQVPGGYPYQPGLTVGKAAAIAQGFTERASKSKIYVVREGSTTNNKLRADLNTLLQPGDMITVEQGFF